MLPTTIWRLVVSAILAVGWAPRAEALSCYDPPPPLFVLVNDADVAFTGVVLEVLGDDPQVRSEVRHESWARIRVEERVKGRVPDEVDVFLDGYGVTDFEVGRRVGVIADLDDGYIRVGACTFEVPPDALVDLAHGERSFAMNGEVAMIVPGEMGNKGLFAIRDDGQVVGYYEFAAPMGDLLLLNVCRNREHLEVLASPVGGRPEHLVFSMRTLEPVDAACEALTGPPPDSILTDASGSNGSHERTAGTRGAGLLTYDGELRLPSRDLLLFGGPGNALGIRTRGTLMYTPFRTLAGARVVLLDEPRSLDWTPVRWSGLDSARAAWARSRRSAPLRLAPRRLPQRAMRYRAVSPGRTALWTLVLLSCIARLRRSLRRAPLG